MDILSAKENECLEMLKSAQKLFNEIITEDPQCSFDTVSFGRNIDYACQSLIMRGMRRKYPNLCFREMNEEDE